MAASASPAIVSPTKHAVHMYLTTPCFMCAAQRPDALADLDDDVLEDMVKEYNFGGGGSEGDKAGNGERKTKRQVRHTDRTSPRTGVMISHSCHGRK